MLSLYDVVKLKDDDVTNGVKKTNIGAVVDVLDNGKAYTVEFIDDDGETIEKALFTEYTEDQLVRVDL